MDHIYQSRKIERDVVAFRVFFKLLGYFQGVLRNVLGRVEERCREF